MKSICLVLLWLLPTPSWTMIDLAPGSLQRVVITNGDDVDPQRLFTLAGAFASWVETHLVIGMDGWVELPDHWRARLQNWAPTQHFSNRLTVHIEQATPTDALQFVLQSRMNRMPDLVIAGLGAWSPLGELGTSELTSVAHVAASLGIPALACSGVNNEPHFLQATLHWLTRFAQSTLVDDLTVGDYLLIHFDDMSQQQPRIIPVHAISANPWLDELLAFHNHLLPQLQLKNHLESH